MIKALNNADEVVLVLRQLLIKHSELPENCVLNGETHQGAKLGKVVNVYDEHEQLISSEIIPFSTSDTFIVFDIGEDNEKSRTQIRTDDKIDCFTYYRINCCVYGDNAATVSQKLRARLTTQKARTEAENNGVHIESFEPVESMNEYINNIYWQRKNIELVLSCRLEFTQVEIDENMTTMKPIVVDMLQTDAN